MNKEQFFAKLNDLLKRLPAAEKNDILQDFQEHFEIGKSEGKTEEEIVASLGSPQQISKELVATYHLEQAETSASTGNILRAVWAVIGLGFFNLVIVLGPFIGLVGVMLGGWAVGISFILSPVLVLINVAVYPEVFSFYDLFFSIGLTGLGIFITIGMYYVTRFVIKGFVKYLNYNVRLVKGGMKDA
ncbi:DUF1700 domain-containing protein [Ornithinibacillus xuwenensis]|uniref:DUF1700 domain-containing protein n=1 Tax=Ornithinibacillus xuwenensis TaxID=3144668 RepID=A0ABU9XKW3_9BACI